MKTLSLISLILFLENTFCENTSDAFNINATAAAEPVSPAEPANPPPPNITFTEPAFVEPIFAPGSSPSGSWQPIPEHELAGGIVRVSGDGPKLEAIADPRMDIGWDIPVTAEMIVTHPNFKYLSPISECGFPANSNQYDKDEEDEEILVPVEKTSSESKDQTRFKRIVGGKTLPPQTHPWMVQLYLFDVSSSEHTFHCAGSLISNRTILTAAHCLTRLAPGTTLDVVIIGNIDRRDIKFCQTSSPEEVCSRPQIQEIDDLEVHNEYNEGNLNHDIALIYLKQPINVNADARPICLPFTSRLLEAWPDLKLTGLGWGSTNKFGNQGVFLSEVLKQVQFDLQPRSLCDKFHLRIYGKVTENRVCTGGNTGRASCNGDSGGPVVKALVVPDLDQGNVERVFQFGIVSAGGHPVDTCGFQGRPAIDTNVLYFMDWILNHIVPGASSYRYVTAEGRPSTWIPASESRDESGFSNNQELNNGNTADEGSNGQPKYVNEFSTGRFVDVSKHPNIRILPSFQECGNLPTAPKKGTRTVLATPAYTPDFDQSVEEMPVQIGAGLESLKRNKRVVGGVPLYLENFYPWMAQIYVRSAEEDELAFRCSGTIISKRHILTTAHCVTELVTPYVFDSIIVGQYNRNATQECIDDDCFSPVHVKITDILIHSDYEKFTHKGNVALIRLSEDLQFTRMVQPICLPRREVLTDGIQLHRYFTVGWGRVLRESTGPSDRMSEILLKMYIDILPRRDCNFVYSRTIDMLDRSRVCGGAKASQGECLGDAGSPLMKKLTIDPSHPLHNKIFQLGIVSFADCGMQGMPTVYMNIIYYMEWILDNLVDSNLN